MASLKNVSFVLLVGIVYPSLGQMMPTRTTFNAATGKAETTMNPLYQPYYGNPNRKPTPKYDFTVTLNDDTSITLRSSLVVKKNKTYVVYKEKGKKQNIFPAQTKSIYSSDGTQRIDGIPADSCWLFLISKGRINSYAMFPTTDSYKTKAIQKGADGKIVPFTKKNLEEMVGTEDEKIKMWFEEYRFLKIIQYYNQ